MHGYQGGLVSHGQPLVILEDVGEARAVSLRQRAAGASGYQQRGVELLAETHLRRGRDGRTGNCGTPNLFRWRILALER